MLVGGVVAMVGGRRAMRLVRSMRCEIMVGLGLAATSA